VYSKRIFEPEMKDGDSKTAEAAASTATQAPRLGLLASNASSVASPTETSTSSLDQATKSLEKLYVTPGQVRMALWRVVRSLWLKHQVDLLAHRRTLTVPVVSVLQDLSPKPMASAQPTPLLNQYVSNAIPTSTGSILSVQSELSFNNANAKPFAAKTTGGGGQSPYNTLLGNNPSAILNNGLNPLAPAVAMGGMLGMQGNVGLHAGQQGMPQQVPQQQQQQPQQAPQQQQQPPHQPAYFVQQAVYLDANGQPMFYRPSKPDFVYSIICALLMQRNLPDVSLTVTFCHHSGQPVRPGVHVRRPRQR
jgi:hypothetical protein